MAEATDRAEEHSGAAAGAAGPPLAARADQAQPDTTAASSDAAPAAYRHIIVLSDGTGNSSASLFKTNVRRLYEALDLADPQDPKRPRQFAFYDDGVGTSSFRPLAVLGGAIGLGLARNVRELYAFVCRTYRPHDKIYAFGFSRGAFTIRVLMGLILTQGLVKYDGNEANLERDVAAAYKKYRRRYKTRMGIRAVRDLLLRKICGRRPSSDSSPAQRGPGNELGVEFVGLWDTVDAYGLPIDELTRAVDLFIWPLTMPDYTLHKDVKCARHALSLDDERNTFHPRLWNELPSDVDRISQVWFAGVHANVGGGYADDSLAYVPLQWMMVEAESKGLRFCKHMCEKYKALQDENGPIYDSRHGLAGYYRYNPRRVERLSCSDEVRAGKPKIHESVLRRIQVGQDGYAPIAVPPAFDVVRINGSTQSFDAYLDDEAARRGTLRGKRGSALESDFREQREQVWNWVWWRRVAYYFTLGTTLLLLALPLIWPPLPKGACESSLCFVSDVIDWTTVLLPAFTATWTDAFSSRPGIFLLLAFLTGVGLWRGGVLQQRVRDAMRSVWYTMPELNPRPRTPDWAAKPVSSGPINSAIQRLRENLLYKRLFRALTRWIMPAAFLLLLCYLAIALVSRTVFAVRSSVGSVCRATEPAQPVTGRMPERPFRTGELCAPTGLILEKGAAYRLRIAIPSTEPWKDDTIDAGPNGVRPEDVSYLMSAAVPLRRHLTQPWFKPMARIGSTGTDEYPLDPEPAIASRRSSAGQVFEARIVARSRGELFLYVNDAVLDLYPGSEWIFYDNNEGSALITVELLTPEESDPSAPSSTASSSR